MDDTILFEEVRKLRMQASIDINKLIDKLMLDTFEALADKPIKETKEWKLEKRN